MPMQARKVSIITIMVALCIGTNYALLGIPNVKIMDLLVFICGFMFGPIAGASVGILSWAVYGAINPYGFVPQVWVATMLFESVYGLTGGFLGRYLASIDFNELHVSLGIFIGATGFILTLVYDLSLNVVYAFAYNEPVVVAMIVGIPFTVLHEVSNALLFGISSVIVIRRLERFVGGKRFGISKK